MPQKYGTSASAPFVRCRCFYVRRESLMEGFLFWQRWLLIVGVVISIFGIFMSFFSGTGLFYLFDSNINPIFWGTADVANGVKGFQRWIYGAGGAKVAGWGLFV